MISQFHLFLFGKAIICQNYNSPLECFNLACQKFRVWHKVSGHWFKSSHPLSLSLSLSFYLYLSISLSILFLSVLFNFFSISLFLFLFLSLSQSHTHTYNDVDTGPFYNLWTFSIFNISSFQKRLRKYICILNSQM